MAGAVAALDQATGAALCRDVTVALHVYMDDGLAVLWSVMSPPPACKRWRLPLTQPRQLWLSRLLWEGRFVAAAGADLVQLNNIAKGVPHEHLIRILTNQALNVPVPDPTLLQFTFGLLNILHGQSDMRNGGIFPDTAGHRGHAFGPHQVDLCCVLRI